MRAALPTKFLIGLALIFMLCGRIVSADVNFLSPDDRAALAKGRGFTIVKKVADIPPAALAVVRASQDDHKFKMADAKGRYQETDVITVPNLPLRQLQFAAVSKDYVLIHYAKGGIAFGYYFLLLKHSGNGFTLVWKAEGSRCASYRRFLKELKTKSIDDRAGYSY